MQWKFLNAKGLVPISQTYEIYVRTVCMAYVFLRLFCFKENKRWYQLERERISLLYNICTLIQLSSVSVHHRVCQLWPCHENCVHVKFITLWNRKLPQSSLRALLENRTWDKHHIRLKQQRSLSKHDDWSIEWLSTWLLISLNVRIVSYWYPP